MALARSSAARLATGVTRHISSALAAKLRAMRRSPYRSARLAGRLARGATGPTAGVPGGTRVRRTREQLERARPTIRAINITSTTSSTPSPDKTKRSTAGHRVAVRRGRSPRDLLLFGVGARSCHAARAQRAPACEPHIARHRRARTYERRPTASTSTCVARLLVARRSEAESNGAA